MKQIQVGKKQIPLVRAIQILEDLVTPERLKKMDQVIAARSRTVTAVFEQIYDLGNLAAVFRSAESYGIQALHVVENAGRLKHTSSRISKGAHKWLDIHKWPDSSACREALKTRGYRIAVSHLGGDRPVVDLGDLDFTHPLALVFGTEKDGVSREFIEAADVCFKIPMLGFTQSFNISVAAAISFYEVVRSRTTRLGQHGDLNADERSMLKFEYLKRQFSEWEAIIERVEHGPARGPQSSA